MGSQLRPAGSEVVREEFQIMIQRFDIHHQGGGWQGADGQADKAIHFRP
jgi:serine/threonine protein kinase HipA of HipAB toxin-antitoxin module